MKHRHLLIAFHSQSGRAQQLAFACFKGAQQEAQQVQVRLRRAIDASIHDMQWADGIILISPENFGAIAGGMKDFLDRMYYPAERAELYALPYALVISAGNSGTGCELQLEKILKGLQAKKIQETIIVYGEPKPEAINQCSDMAQAFAVGLEMGMF